MLGSEILFLLFVLIPCAIGYCTIVWSIANLSWKITDYFKIRKQFMKQCLASKENNEDS